MNKNIIFKNYFTFDSEKKCLRNDSHVVKIHSSASHCLEVLTKKQGEIVSHEELHDYAWKSFGIEVSSASIYQSISTLRKSIKELGVEDEIIKTVPKRGFVISREIEIIYQSIQRVEDSVVKTKALIEKNEKNLVENKHSKVSTILNKNYSSKTEKRRRLRLTFFSTFTFTLVLSTYFVFFF